jgi:polysaccharide biosynthesis transport protein
MTTIWRNPAWGRSSPDEQGFKRYYRTILDHIWLVIACVVIAVGAAAAYVETATRQYQASAEMLANPVTSDSSTLGLPLLQASSDPTRDTLTAASLITTPQVATAVVRALGLNMSPTSLLGHVTATPIGDSNLISVQAQWTSAAQAQRVANEFTTQVIATRTAALHAAIGNILPGLISQLDALPPADRSGSALSPQIGQLEQLRNAADPTITLAASAGLPSGPVTPKTKLSLLAGLLGGLILGVGAAFARQALDPHLKREEQLRDLFDLPILGRIPRERKRRRPASPLLPTELSPRSEEGYRTLRTMLTSRKSASTPAYLITGSSPGEGKTTSAISLADALAQGGSRVILIEADLRRPRIAETLGLTPAYGTEDVMISGVELEDALVTRRFGSMPVRVLAVRNPGIDVANRLSFGVAQHLVRKAKAIADYVVIDSPPLIAVGDALPLALVADEILIVAQFGVSKLGKLAELHDLLVDHGSQPTGMILIGQSPSRLDAYDYYAPNVAGQRPRRNGDRSGRPSGAKTPSN